MILPSFFLLNNINFKVDFVLEEKEREYSRSCSARLARSLLVITIVFNYSFLDFLPKWNGLRELSLVNFILSPKLMQNFLKASITCLIAASSLIFMPSVLAETEITSISEILAEPKDDMEVRIRGQIIDQEPGEDDYIFTDGQEQITVEIEQENFQYAPDETIEIYGVVNLESAHGGENDPTPEAVEIEVTEIKLVQE